MFKVVVFDVAGTIVSDDGVVISTFEQVFQELVPDLWQEHRARFLDYAQKTMGQSKIEVFAALLGDQRMAAEAAERFQHAYLENLHQVMPFEGVVEMFAILRAKGIKIALNTGFNRATLNVMIEQFGWGSFIDASVTPQEAGAGRPSPAMLRQVSNQLGVSDPELFAVLGDTATDIETAKAFGAGLAIGVLSGAHTPADFEYAGADLVLATVTDAIPHLIR